MKSYLLGISAIVALMAFWGLVQKLWIRSFPEFGSDVDALAIRKNCQSCKDKGTCQKTENISV